MKSDEDDPVTWEDRSGDKVTGYATTKMSLDFGCGYNMWPGEPVEDCEVDGEVMWHDQVRMLAEDIIENQGIIDYDLDDGDFDEDGDDVIAGVTITVDGYIDAVKSALDRIKLSEDDSPADFDVPEFDEEGEYTPGIHFGYTDGNQNTVGLIAVNDDGNIEYATADSVYLKSDDNGPLNWEAHGNENTGIATTKMSLDLGCGYNMWPGESVVDCEVDGETMWHDQVAMTLGEVVEAQGFPSLDLDGDGYFDEDSNDVVSGVTISVDNYLDAIKVAIDNAK